METGLGSPGHCIPRTITGQFSLPGSIADACCVRASRLYAVSYECSIQLSFPQINWLRADLKVMRGINQNAKEGELRESEARVIITLHLVCQLICVVCAS
jgi:hypothetical protein